MDEHGTGKEHGGHVPSFSDRLISLGLRDDNTFVFGKVDADGRMLMTLSEYFHGYSIGVYMGHETSTDYISYPFSEDTFTEFMVSHARDNGLTPDDVLIADGLERYMEIRHVVSEFNEMEHLPLMWTWLWKPKTCPMRSFGWMTTDVRIRNMPQSFALSIRDGVLAYSTGTRFMWTDTGSDEKAVALADVFVISGRFFPAFCRELGTDAYDENGDRCN